jgi:hypothetical protein
MDEREAIVAFLRREAERYSNAARAAEHPVWRVRCQHMAEAAGDLASEVERGTHLDDDN